MTTAIDRAKALKKPWPVGSCLAAVRTCFGLEPNGHELTAAAAWLFDGGAHGANTHTVIAAPANVPMYWTGGSHGAGHVAISDGVGGCWSTDWAGRTGLFTHVQDYHEITRAWKLTYVGWSEMVEGHRVLAHVVA